MKKQNNNQKNSKKKLNLRGSINGDVTRFSTAKTTPSA